MERLTKRESANVGGRELVLCNHKKEDCNDSCMYESGCKWQHKALRKLKEYEDAEEQGLLLRLPCKVGDEFWELNHLSTPPTIYPRWAHTLGHVYYCAERLGKYTFVTREEAEQALAKMKEV